MQLLQSAGRQWDDLCVQHSLRTADQRRGFIAPSAEQFRVLRELVLPEVADLSQRSSFRQLVLRPFEFLVSPESPEQCAISALKACIRSTAEVLQDQLLRHMSAEVDTEFNGRRLASAIESTNSPWVFADDFFCPTVGTFVTVLHPPVPQFHFTHRPFQIRGSAQRACASNSQRNSLLSIQHAAERRIVPLPTRTRPG